MFWLVGFPVVLLLAHLIFRKTSPRAIRLPALSDEEMMVPLVPRDEKTTTVCVTGGAGFLGSAVVRQLAEKDVFVVVLDRSIPQRDIRNVSFHKVDLATEDLTPFFEHADAVVHVAGLVFLRDDPNLLYNAHHVVTRNVIRCARKAGVSALCFTSSGGAVTSPYVRAPQLRVPSDFTPDLESFPFASHYSRHKYAAELAVLAANQPGFATLALRLPGLYGIGDTLIVDPLLDGTLTHVPSRAGADGCPIDFCYVENAAHAHVVAVNALLNRPRVVGGRSFNVTNGESETRPVVAMWNELLTRCKPGAPKLRPLPYAAAFALACIVEAIDWFTCGRVPYPSHAIWGLTRASLGFATTPISLALTGSRELGYTPPFTTAQSFEDIAKKAEAKARAKAEGEAKKAD